MFSYFLAIAMVSTFMLSGNLMAESFWDMGPEKVRKMLNDKFMAIPAETPQVLNVQNITITNENRVTPLRIYTPNDSKDLPIILYIHGGAWVAGNLDTHDNLARYLSQNVPALVVSVGYTNAPEGKFPKSLEQCYDALLWTVKNAKDFNGNIDRLAVVGDSAGGNMAAVITLMARDRHGPSIKFQVLINPVVDNTWNGTLKPQGNHFDDERWIASQYVVHEEEAKNPYVSPLYAKDLTHLPPALILLAEKDMFRPDAQKYAERLADAGIPTNIYTQRGVGHLAGNGGRASPLARESLDVAVAALRGALAPDKI